ncbi:DUF262 domain-containing protein [Kroppenstedtia eburnea]|uniref:GmrSD restriction endonuclease domain-containing protein n=1 Tax=Kroppenstedtia eburnea TaxID=714067 RepID=UPI0002E8D055
MSTLTIRKILEAVYRGQIRIPAFQRGFVWEPDHVAFFMDSIYKKYPFGSLLFWRTREQLRTEKRIGPYMLPIVDRDYPIDYVLDGQQRITSLFGVFQTELTEQEEKGELWTKVYFDYKSESNAQESQFFALEDKEVDLEKHFPLKCLFDTTEYRKATRNLSEDDARKIDDMQTVFKEALIPVQTIETDDKATVAIIFERVNRAGVRLDNIQLLSAWTWSEEFSLHEQFDGLSQDLEPFGFKEIGEDMQLLLRCCSAVLNHDASPDTLVDLDGAILRRRFEEITNGIKGAIDFLRDNINVQSLENLPFSTLLVPLSVFFTQHDNKHIQMTQEQRKVIIKWFWRSCFSKRYSSGVLRNLKTDIEEMVKLKNGELSRLGQFEVKVKSDFFITNRFKINSVNTKSFILLLAQMQPASFISGNSISLGKVLKEYNRNEFHHAFPKAYLRESKQNEIYHESCLANFCFISKSDNTQLGGKAPSVYRNQMPPDISAILSGAVCPDSLFEDDYKTFIDQRSELLAAKANSVMK